MTKVLIAIPYHKNKRYVIDHLFNWLETAELGDAEVIMRWHRGPFGEKDAVKKQREFFRLHALNNGYTHLYFIDVDTIPPIDVIPRLLAHDEDIVGALYNSRNHGGKLAPLAWRDASQPYDFLGQEPGVFEVDGMGMGAVMFSAKALQEFSFIDNGFEYDDWPVYRHLASKGYKIYVDTTLVCKHYATDKEYF